MVATPDRTTPEQKARERRVRIGSGGRLVIPAEIRRERRAAERLGLPALTADRSWVALQLGVQVDVIR